MKILLRLPVMVLPLISTLILLSGCYPNYAPPVRIDHYGAPSAVSVSDRAEVVASTALLPIPTGAHGGITYGVNDTLQLELGGNGAFDLCGMGYGGARWAPLAGKFKRALKFTLDLEGGLGAGAGGQNACGGDFDEYGEGCVEGVHYDNIPWHKRFAAGGYMGFGVGLNISWFDIFLRGRGQLTGAENVPVTFWFSTAVGLQATLKKWFKIYIAGMPIYGYVNQKEEFFWGGAELGLSFSFSISKTFPGTISNP